MDPIEAAIQDNFANYMPSNTLEPQGIAPLIEEQQTTLPPVSSLKDIAKNVAKNKALEYAAGKIGLNAAQASGLMSILGMGANAFAPLTAVSALTGKSLGISEYLANKRAQKQALKRNIINDSQGTISTVPVNTMNMQPSAQDIARGGGNIPASTTAPSAPAARQSRQTSGIGGLHSGY